MTQDHDGAPVETAPCAPIRSRAFEADVSRLLSLMVHSVYSERDIFLRELVSNAADACEKLRYEAIAQPELIADGAPFEIRITADAAAHTLAIADNGIGMSEDDLVSALGTIASSGTRNFLDKLGADGAQTGAQLIGQFGIGFYSAFMVADRVVVETRRAGGDAAFRWESDGKGAYSVASLPLEAAPTRGTRVILALNEASHAFAEDGAVERIIEEHSGAIAVPIVLETMGAAEPAAPRRLTEGMALWARPKADVTPEQYADFYRALGGQFDEPALTMHWRAEGRHEYSVLAFVPGARPLDLFEPARKSRAKLYVRRVLINADADILPGWLRFVRIVVDSADLPLNVSREMIQTSPVFNAIRKGVANRVLQELTKFAESDAAGYATVWEHFGAVLKEGLYEDPERRDALFKLARFTTSAGDKRTLAAYAADLRPNQTAIYYLTGDDQKRLAISPQLEGFRARGIEVLLLADPVDAFWVSTAAGYEGKPFKSVAQGSADIDLVPLREGAPPAAEAPSPAVATLLAFFKQVLGEAVEDVRASQRLAQSPACLVAPAYAPDRRLERMLAESGRGGFAVKPVFEINAAHPLIAALAKRLGEGADKTLVDDSAWLLFDEARLMDGDAPADAGAFAARLIRVLGEAAGGRG